MKVVLGDLQQPTVDVVKIAGMIVRLRLARIWHGDVRLGRSTHGLVVDALFFRGRMLEGVTTSSAIVLLQPSIESDPDLIARCLAGDQTAWTELVGRYHRLVFTVARRAGLSREDAEDTFQVVFTTLYRRLGGLHNQERLAAWLITTTHREAIRVRRRLTPQDELREETATGEEPIEDLVERETQRQTVREAMAALDDRCASLLRALFLETDQSYMGIAERLGVAVGSIGPTRARCLARLRALLNARGFSPADVP